MQKENNLDYELPRGCFTTRFFNNEEGWLMWQHPSGNESAITGFPFRVTGFGNNEGLWTMEIEFTDLNGKMRQTTISRYDLWGQAAAVGRLYLNGMPHPYDIPALLYYLRTITPTDLEEKDNEQEQSKQN